MREFYLVNVQRNSVKVGKSHLIQCHFNLVSKAEDIFEETRDWCPYIRSSLPP